MCVCVWKCHNTNTNYRTQLVFTSVIIAYQFSLASWVKRKELIVLIVQNSKLMYIHKDKTNNLN